MMTITIDARGLKCPAPVIKTKNALENSPGEEITTIVDNMAAKENIKRLGENYGYQVRSKEEDGNYVVTLLPSESCEIIVDKIAQPEAYVVLVGSDRMGQGEDELGKILMKGYFYALTEAEPYPKSIMFINSAIKLTVEGSEALENIKTLEAKGVEILSCGTCLDFYQLKDKLAVGSVTNMYTIVEKMNDAAKVIKI